MKKIILLSIALLMFGCTSEKLPEIQPPYILENLNSYPFLSDGLFPNEIKINGLTSIKQPLAVRAGELANYVGTTAEDYLTHQFIGLVAQSYSFGEDTFSVEIAQFVEPQNAYGFYSRLRPEKPETVTLGAEAFTLGNNIYFAKGEYVVTMSAVVLNEKSQPAFFELAAKLDSSLEVGASLPIYYMMFPFKTKIVPSTRYYPYQHLDIPGFDAVYTCSYQNRDNVYTLFITIDKELDKFKLIKDYASQLGEITEVNKFPFEDKKALAFKHTDGKIIVAGRVREKLVGVIGYYNGVDENLVRKWVEGLK